jgi:hypothetical protein
MKRNLFLFVLVFVLAMQVNWHQLEPSRLPKFKWSFYTGLALRADAQPRTYRRSRGIEHQNVKSLRSRTRKLTPKEREALYEAFPGYRPVWDSLERRISQKILQTELNKPNKLIISEDFKKGKTLVERLSENVLEEVLFGTVLEKQIVLGYLGYYDGKLDNKPGPKTKAAIAAFQQDNKILTSGTLDAETELALVAWHNKLLQDLSSIGFEDYYLPTAMAWYASHLGLKDMPSGKELTEIRKNVDLDKLYLKDVLAVAEGQPSPDTILTFQKKGKKTHELLKRPDGHLELWTVSNGTVLDRVRGKPAIERLDKIATEEVKANSDEVISFVRIGLSSPESKDNIYIQFGRDLVKISKSEMNALLSGTGEVPMLDKFLGTKTGILVVWRDPFNREKMRNYPDLLRFAEGLRLRYGDRHKIFFDDDVSIGRDNAINLPVIHSPSDVAAYVPRKTFEFKDYGVIDHIEDFLAESGVEIIKGLRAIQVSNLLIIVGHKNSEFIASIERAGKAGFLEKKYVVQFSCYEAGDEPFNSRNIKEFGIRGIHQYLGEIKPQAVEEVMFSMSEFFQEKQVLETNWYELLNECVDRALKENSQSPLREEILKIGRGMTQISLMIRHDAERKLQLHARA